MKNLRIGKKLLLTFGIIIVLFATVVVVSFLSLKTNGDRFTDFYTNGYAIMARTIDMRRAIQSAAKNVGYSTMSLDVDATGQYIDAAQDNMAELAEGIEFLEGRFQGDKSLITKLEATLNESKEVKEQVFELARANKSQEAADLYFSKYQPYLLSAMDILKEMNTFSSESATASYQSAQDNETSTLIFVLTFSGIALAVTVLLALYISRALTRPLRELENVAKEMSQGSLHVSLNYHSKDELGVLSDSMRILTDGIATIVEDIRYLLGEMAKGNFQVHTRVEDTYIGDYLPILHAMRDINSSLSNALSQINQSSDQVSSGSEQVSSGAQALSQGATEQASAIQELAATITEISDKVKKNAENAQMASETAAQAGDSIVAGNEKMEHLNEAILQISTKSSEISKIIKTIEDIAFQTNILALNAAVEAARAGAAGKGFAVVADEVRSLANKSQEAAKDTTALIEESIHAVENGTQIAGETASAMQEVVGLAGRVSDLIGEIALASNEQATSITQVTQGIDQISSVVQTNSATAEESAAASEELSGQAQMLKNLVAKFRLKEESGRGSAAPDPVSLSDSQMAYSSKY